jgi:hypothetical protein
VGNTVKRKSRNPVKFSPEEWEVLEMANEDWYHLWEIPGAIQDAKQISSLLSDLIRRGYIYLASVRFSDNSETPIATEEALSVIAADESWVPKEDDVAFSFWATPKGEEIWMKPPSGLAIKTTSDRSRRRSRLR